EEAWPVVIGALDSLLNAPDGVGSEVFQRLTALSARIMLHSGESPAEIRKGLVQLLDSIQGAEIILCVIREIDNHVSSEAKYYRLVFECSDHQPDLNERSRYFMSVDVIADTPDEAINLVRQIEQEPEYWTCVIRSDGDSRAAAR